MIHTYPKREWYVLNYLVPSMIKQGIQREDIKIISDRDKIGNLKSWLKSLELVEDDTWHLQDDIIISSEFKAKTEVLDYLKTIVCGFVHYDFNTGSTLCTGFTIPKFMFMSFPCIFIPKKYSDDFIKWFYNPETHVKYKDLIESGKNDDMIFKKVCSRIESKPRLFQDRRGRRSLQKLFYIVGATIGRPQRAIHLSI